MDRWETQHKNLATEGLPREHDGSSALIPSSPNPSQSHLHWLLACLNETVVARLETLSPHKGCCYYRVECLGQTVLQIPCYARFALAIREAESPHEQLMTINDWCIVEGLQTSLNNQCREVMLTAAQAPFSVCLQGVHVAQMLNVA